MDDILRTAWHVFAAYVALVEPVLGVRFYRGLCRRLQVDSRAREQGYIRLLIWEWAWMAVIALLLITTPNPFEALGFRAVSGLGWGLLVGPAIALSMAMLLMRFRPSTQSSTQEVPEQVSALLPTTSRERWGYAAVAVTAGVCEEVLYRGFLTLYLSRNLPGLHPMMIAIIAGAVFGLGHLYQGWKRVLQTGIAGVGFGFIYWYSGLVPVIVLHALADLRVLLIWKAPATPVRTSN